MMQQWCRRRAVRGFDVMEQLHQKVYGTPHPSGHILKAEIGTILKERYRLVEVVDTPLNRTCISSLKRSEALRLFPPV